MNKDVRLYQLIWLSRPLMQAASACVEKGLAGTELTVRMRAVMEILRTEGELAVPDIAVKLEIKRQYVQLMVNETLASGLTEKCPNPRHKRSSLVRLTQKGCDLIDDVMARELEIMKIIGQDFTDEDIATALAVVQSVTSKLKAQEGDM
ncbi:hypothetical protein RYZ26_15720 [Terasakiella sp. A23]|uniref:MarR family winged helix-turn-helix transcriptional regulator n=1 Tax=Terasakiella sp. FCG-A23 TaxID=3080561 RepID=UPI0029550794|nr:hypothetical protein [Terasakiella sp. A23]MDV7341055.1 hypothetical protein [Terasakiella sp. A23]